MLKVSNTVLGHNMFAYTENNPVMNVDPTGYCAFADGNTGSYSGFDKSCSSSYNTNVLSNYIFTLSDFWKYFINRRSTKINSGHIQATVAFDNIFGADGNKIDIDDATVFLNILAQHNARGDGMIGIFLDGVKTAMTISLKIAKVTSIQEATTLISILSKGVKEIGEIDVNVLGYTDIFDGNTAIGATLISLYNLEERSYLAYYYYERYEYWEEFYD